MPDKPPPTLVLLPGMDGTRILFGPLANALADRAALRIVEYPSDGPCDYEAATNAALAAVDQCGPCHVLGWSFSGPVALRVARHRPEAVRSVTLAATFVQPPLPWLRYAGPLLVTPVVFVARTIRRLPIWLGRAPEDPLRRDKAELWQRIGARTLARRSRAIRTLDARPDLAHVRQPLQYLASTRDTVVPRHNLDAIRSLRPETHVVELAGDHFALYAQPDLAAQAIMDFVWRHETGQDRRA